MSLEFNDIVQIADLIEDGKLNVTSQKVLRTISKLSISVFYYSISGLVWRELESECIQRVVALRGKYVDLYIKSSKRCVLDNIYSSLPLPIESLGISKKDVRSILSLLSKSSSNVTKYPLVKNEIFTFQLYVKTAQLFFQMMNNGASAYYKRKSDNKWITFTKEKYEKYFKSEVKDSSEVLGLTAIHVPLIYEKKNIIPTLADAAKARVIVKYGKRKDLNEREKATQFDIKGKKRLEIIIRAIFELISLGKLTNKNIKTTTIAKHIEDCSYNLNISDEEGESKRCFSSDSFLRDIRSIRGEFSRD